MAHPPKNILPKLNSKWLALRQQHQNESENFQRMVTKNRAEFEARVDAARKKLLAQHIGEESEFWSQHGQAAAPAKTAAPTVQSAQTQPQGGVRGSMAASSKKATPIAKTPVPQPATPRMQLQPPVTPSRAPQQPKMQQVPPAPRKPQRQPVQQPGRCEVVDLCSDDDEDISASQNKPAKKPDPLPPVRQQPVAQEPAAQDSMDIDGASNSTAFSIPEASIELFGGAKHLSVPHRSQIKDEEVGRGSPKLASPFTSRFTSTSRAVNGLRPEPASPFLQRATTEQPQFGPSTACSSHTPSSTPGHGSWDRGVYAATSGFPQRAGSLIPSSKQPLLFANRPPSLSTTQPADCVGRDNTPSTSFAQRRTSASSSVSAHTFQNQTSSNVSTPSSAAVEPESHPWARLDRLNQKQPDEATNRPSNRPSPNTSPHARTAQEQTEGSAEDTAQNQRAASVSSGVRDGNSTSDVTVEMEDAVESSSATSAQADQPQYPSGSFAALATSGHHVRVQQLPSPASPHASVVTEPCAPDRRGDLLSASGFRKPCLPASAAPSNVVCPSIAPKARHVWVGTADSRDSSLALPASPHSQRGDSIVSRTSDNSGCTGASQKRKRTVEHSLSSDEDEDPASDYAPSEPDSPRPSEPARRAKGAPVAKKSKVAPALKTTPRVERFMGKNGYGFKIKPVPKPKLDTANALSSTASKSSAPTPSSITRKVPPHSRVPTARSSTEATKPKPRPIPVSKKRTLRKKPIPQPSKRRAAVAAEGKIQDIFDKVEGYETKSTSGEADDTDDTRLPDGMSCMGITPVPASQVDAESVDMLVESESEQYHTPPPSRAGSNIASKSPNNPKSPPGFDDWTKSRRTGDRHMSTQPKSRFQATVEDDESEPDIGYDIKSDKCWQKTR